MGGAMLERDLELKALGEAVGEAGTGAGSVALVHGEAGIGKSSLVRAIPEILPPTGRFLVGYCDDLATPRVFGPLRDLIGGLGAPFTRALQRGDRAEVLDALRDEFGWATNPTVLVVEDVHWADEGTLDVVRYLLRRAAQLPLVLVLTYRDDGLGIDHPLRHVLGLAARVARVRRLRLAPLSRAAVRQLSTAAVRQLSTAAVRQLSTAAERQLSTAAERQLNGAAERQSRAWVDADEVFAVTSGNPYFVTEILAAGEVTAVPATVVDSIRARTAGLAAATREAVELLAVVPDPVPMWLLETLVPGAPTVLAPADERGLLTVTPLRVGFRHELARRAVVASMTAARRVAANRVVLAALLAQPDVEASRVMPHAVEAGDVDAIVHYGPIAARVAAGAGSHREAATHLRRVLELGRALGARAEADLWEALAIENYIIGAPTGETLAAIRRAVELRPCDDLRACGVTLRWLSRISWLAGDPDGAVAAAEDAITLHTADGAGDDSLAMALSNKSQLHSLAGQDVDAISMAERALALARDNPAVRSHALNNVANILLRRGDPHAFARMEESLRVALDANEPEHACRAYLNLIEHEIINLRVDAVREHVTEAIEYAERSKFTWYVSSLRTASAKLHFVTGEWNKVESAATDELRGALPDRCNALTVIGRVRLRRGDSGAVALLREAWEIAVRMRESQWIAPIAAALAEAVALSDADPQDVSREKTELAGAYELARRHGAPARQAELVYWLRRSGRPVRRHGLEHPYALLADGRWREAAEVWRNAGVRYEYALALSESPDPRDHVAALPILDALGAEPLARQVRARLKRLGVSRVPRGPAQLTRGNPGGLTGRQAEVVRLLVRGMTNAEIADTLVLSVRTVDSHVAAALDKLGSRTRKEAVTRAAALGITPHS